MTGIRALARIASADFNIMQGGEVQGFVRRLKAEGYRTLGTVASSAVYFNAATAYRSIGLDQVEFLGDTRAAKAEEDGLLFDGRLFEANLARLRRAAAAETPGLLFNYVVGIYGHYPYRDNYSKRPDKVVTSGGDDEVRRIANQFFYRTQALGRFLAELRTLDPEAIIYVTSDHLPPIFDTRFRPPDGHFRNSALLLVAGRPVDVSGRRYFQIPGLIWDLLTEVPAVRPGDPAVLEALYFRALRESLRPE